MKDFWNRLSWKGIIIGSIVDVVGSSIWGALLIEFVASAHHLSLVGEQGIPAAQNLIQVSTGLFILNLAVGAGFSVLGGYIAASIAKQNELTNGVFSSIFCVLSGIYGIFALSAEIPLALGLLDIIVSPLLGLLGGYIRLKMITTSSQSPVN